jgi:hypothetical protein
MNRQAEAAEDRGDYDEHERLGKRIEQHWGNGSLKERVKADFDAFNKNVRGK